MLDRLIQGGSERHKSRSELIISRVRAIPEGFVRTYGDIDPGAPRLVGRVLATTHDVPWHRVVRADGSLAKGAHQRDLLLREGVPMRGERVDLHEARLPPIL
jgi:methylated-DNA-protein-cysteine methyltransferase related protein